MIATKTMHLVSYGGNGEWDPSKFDPISNARFIKPKGGLWTSPIGSEWGWKDWCEAEGFGLDQLKNAFEIDYTGRTLVIDSLADAAEMPWLLIGNCLRCPDFEAIEASGVDAIHLTVNGERETRLVMEHSLYGWDCETVLIMNPATIKVVPPKLRKLRLSA